MHDIKITSSVPMPHAFPRGRKPFYSPRVRTMKIGDSFTIPMNQRGNAYRWARNAGVKVSTTCHKCNRHTVRVFRVA